jgi:hypothetical protein|uniref:Alkylmercury lyase n=1 Tax=Gracilinema caldarium TaxID=215591 RepID=A0A7C3IJL1_9SPIR
MIEFQYFEGCPNAAKTLENLRSALKAVQIEESAIVLREVPSPEQAEALHFQGSPTILIDGIDIYTGHKPDSYNYTCRIYTFSGKKTGVIPQGFIEEKLRKG